MPGGQLERLGPLRADELAHRLRGLGRDDVVLARDDVQERPAHVPQRHGPPVEQHAVLHERVLAHELDGLAERPAGERDVVAGPLAHDLVGLHLLVVPELLPQHGVLRDVGGGLEHAEGVADDLGRDVAGLVEQVVGREPVLVEHPAEHAHLVEVDGRRHGDQRRHRQVGVGRAEQQRQQPAVAVADEVDLVGAGGLAAPPRPPPGSSSST